jgi:hypothetical protein
MNAPRPIARFLVAAAVLVLALAAVMVSTAALARAREARSRAQAVDRTLALEARFLRARLERLEAFAGELAALPLPAARGAAAPGGRRAAAPSGDATTESEREAALGAFARARRLELAGEIEAPPPADGAGSWWPAATEGGAGEEIGRGARRLAAELAAAPAVRSGLVSADGGLYALAGRGIGGAEDDPARAVVVAQRVDELLVRELDQAIEAELAILLDTGSGPALGASTIDPGLGAEIPLALRRLGNWRSVLSEASALRLELSGASWDSQIAPLPGLEGEAVGVAAALLPLRAPRGMAGVLALEGMLGLVGLAALAVVVLPARRSAPAAPQPGESAAARLAAAVERARASGVYVAPEALPAEYDGLARELPELLEERGRLLRNEAERRRSPARFELAAPDAPLRATAEDLALLAIELRSLARGETVRHPEAALARARRDLAVARREVERRGGRVEAWLGHRLLASFAGQQGVVAAVEAAAGTARELGIATSAFEEPRPPAAALSCGEVAVGVGSEDESAARGLAGRPLQQLDELLREAMVGDLLASQAVVQRAGEDLARRGIGFREHAGLRTAQKVFAIDLATVGADADQPGAAAGSGG